jgi:hypothetical protein
MSRPARRLPCSLMAAPLLAAMVGFAATAMGANGQLLLTVVDKDTQKPIPCRLHLKTQAGKARKVERAPFWHDHIVIPGEITLKLPLGRYTFELERGPEYLNVEGNFTLEHFADDSKRVELHRFINMSEHGWWSGDLDVRRPAADVELLMRADDLHVAPLVTWSDNESTWSGKPLPKQLLVCFDRDRWYHLMAGVHNRAGGMLFFYNLAEPMLLGDAGPEYPSPMEFIRRAREKPDAWVDLGRPYAWDLPMLVAQGQLNSIQVCHGQICRDRTISKETDGKPRDSQRFPGIPGNALWSHDVYFRLLECGLHVTPSAGSGSGSTPNPVGYNRVYVHLDGTLEYNQWWDAFRAGRVTVTNGPLLRPLVRHELPGHTFHAEEGQAEDFEIGLTLSTRDPISYMEIVKNGKIEHEIRFSEYAKGGRLPKVHFDKSGWFLVRAVTDVQQTFRFAMTGPYYVEFGDKRRISRKAVQFFNDWLYERAREIKLDDPGQRREVLEYHRKAREFWQDLLSKANAP